MKQVIGMDDAISKILHSYHRHTTLNICSGLNYAVCHWSIWSHHFLNGYNLSRFLIGF